LLNYVNIKIQDEALKHFLSSKHPESSIENCWTVLTPNGSEILSKTLYKILTSYYMNGIYNDAHLAKKETLLADGVWIYRHSNDNNLSINALKWGHESNQLINTGFAPIAYL